MEQIEAEGGNQVVGFFYEIQGPSELAHYSLLPKPEADLPGRAPLAHN